MRLATKTINLGSGVNMDLVYIPGGSFLMGSDQTSTEQPVHQVTVPSFWMGKFQVTQEQWVAVMGENPSYFEGDTRPVEQITWHQAKEFCEKVSNNTGHKVRLPTESEWEYAARCGTTTEYSFGDDKTKFGEYAWFNENSGRETHQVGQKNPNQFGLYDMYGNVWEWLEDYWHNNYDNAPTDGSAWLTGGNSALRVLRGGSVYDFSLGSSYRCDDYPDDQDDSVGFRVVVEYKSKV